MGMDPLPGLQTFLAVARNASFTAAAQELGVPGSTVSRRVARLEEALGEALFERTTRHVALTDAGRLLLERGAPLVRALHALADDVAGSSGDPVGVLRIATPPGFGREFLVDFVALLRERHPRLSVEVVITAHPPHLIDAAFDLVVLEGPPPVGPWIAREMGPADRLLVGSPDYLARRGVPSRAEDLSGHDALCLLGDPLTDETWPLRAGGEVRVTPLLSSNDLDLVREAAIGGLGLAMLPLPVVATALLAGRLTPVLPGALGAPAKIYVLYPPTRRGSAKLTAFFDAAAQVAERFGKITAAAGA